MFDWCANGQQLKCLTVTDEWTKEGLAIEVDGRIRSPRVIEVLSRLVSERGAPLYLRSDNGPEFVVARAAEVDRRSGHRHGIDRSRQALAEWRDGELQRQVPRRVPEPGVVPLAGRGEGRDRELAPALQRGASAFEPRLPHAGRVRGEDRGARRSVAAGNGSDRCGMWGLRAPTRCITVPQGASEGSTEGGVLKLSVVRRNRAGQPFGVRVTTQRLITALRLSPMRESRTSEFTRRPEESLVLTATIPNLGD